MQEEREQLTPSTSGITSCESRSTSASPTPARKSRKHSCADTLEEVIVENLRGLRERCAPQIPDDDELFGRQVAATLRHLDPCTKAIRKMQIQQLLFNSEFNEHCAPSPYGPTLNF